MGNKIDWGRVHVAGKLPHYKLINLYQVSSAHIYLTYPFVLSWSLLEAMSAGCLVICSDTEPVKEIVKDKENGLLFDFSDHALLSNHIENALTRKGEFTSLREAARDTIVRHYSLDQSLIKQTALIDAIYSKAI